MKIDQVNIEIFLPEETEKPLPLVILNDDMDQGKETYDLCKELNTKPFVMAYLSGFDWNSDLSPWPCDPIFRKGEPFAGKADEYLELITEKILPAIQDELNQKGIIISYNAIAGYSLAGLFALYAATKTDLFHRIVSASGSLWYPDFEKYFMENGISPDIDRIYLSLGDLESRTKNPIMSTVQDKTERICQYLSDKIKAVFELNEGNHFKDASLRTAKGIRYILED